MEGQWKEHVKVPIDPDIDGYPNIDGPFDTRIVHHITMSDYSPWHGVAPVDARVLI